MTSIEEKVEEHYKSLLDALGIRHFGKTEEINGSITKALEEAKSKSGGDGNNYPDIKLLLDNKADRRIPVMIEAKGTKGKLECYNTLFFDNVNQLNFTFDGIATKAFQLIIIILWRF